MNDQQFVAWLRGFLEAANVFNADPKVVVSEVAKRLPAQPSIPFTYMPGVRPGFTVGSPSCDRSATFGAGTMMNTMSATDFPPGTITAGPAR